jgi:hypothetical protein
MARDVPMVPLPVSHVLMACDRRYRGAALGRVRLSIHVTTAADTMQTPTTHSPSRLLPVAAGRVGQRSGDVGRHEARRVAQRVDQRDPRRRRGAGQVGGGERPEAGQRSQHATGADRDREDREPGVRHVEGHGDRETADQRGHSHPDARCVQTIMAMSPNAKGIAVIRPCCTVEKVVPYWAAKPLTIVGRKKPSAYNP